MFYLKIQLSQPALLDFLFGSQWADNAILYIAQTKAGMLWVDKTTVSPFTIKPAFPVPEILIF